MTENVDVEKVLNDLRAEVEMFYFGDQTKIKELYSSALELSKNYTSIEDLKRRVSINFLKEIALMLKNDELNHGDFFLDKLKDSEFWKPLAKMVLLKRIEELKKCKILKKGKKLDVSGLKETHFGKFVMDKLNFGRRSVVSEEEYKKITDALKKLKFDLPVVVNPTETEKFFSK